MSDVEIITLKFEGVKITKEKLEKLLLHVLEDDTLIYGYYDGVEVL